MFESSTNDYAERDAFVLQIHEECYELLYPFCRYLCHRYGHHQSLVDDLIQDFELEVLTNWEKNRDGYHKHGVSHFYKLIRFNLTDRFRKEESLQRLAEIFCHKQPEEGSIYYHNLEGFLQHVYEVFSKLLSERDAVIMRLYVEGHPNRDIANQFKMNENTLASCIHRAKKKLKGHLP